jgi:hypothetical protein
MRAKLLMRERRVSAVGFIEAIVWRLPQLLSGSTPSLKYRLADIGASERVRAALRQRGRNGRSQARGHQRVPYVLVSVDQRLDDFFAEVAALASCAAIQSIADTPTRLANTRAKAAGLE